jgi:hypothetical protein
MWIEVLISQKDLAEVAGQMAPLTIQLGKDGRLEVTDPSEVRLVEGQGLLLTCKARLRWSVLGVDVPVTIRTLSLRVRPEIVRDEGGASSLAFAFHIENADIAVLPGLLDRSVTDLVNRELEARRHDLSWHYGETLSHSFKLPAALHPLETIDVSAVDAQVKLAGAMLAFAVRFEVDVSRRDATLLG